MNKSAKIACIFIVLMMLTATIYSQRYEGYLLIDHNCLDLSKIPMEMIDSVKANWRMHYAHASHGHQLIDGLEIVENNDPRYDASVGYTYLPDEPGTFCVFDGDENIDVIDPEGYWQTAEGMNATRSVLDNNPSINVSGFQWCGEMSEGDFPLQAYFDSMAVLESEYPDVTFIYFTGQAQRGAGGGMRRFVNNNLIRQYCADNGKVLFDFADIDCWWYNPETEEWEFSTYYYEGYGFEGEVPIEHPAYAGEDCGHSNYLNCEHKGIALWWMMACLAGWRTSQSVAITSFVGDSHDGRVVLKWTLDADSSFEGVNIYRSEGGGEPFTRLNEDLITSETRDEYFDSDVVAGRTYLYKLGAVDLEGEWFSQVISVTVTPGAVIPKSINLYQNYPNPFNPSTTIKFYLADFEKVVLNVFDVEGKKVRTLFDGEKGAGEHVLQWNGTNDLGNDVGPGVFYYSLRTGKTVLTRKLIILR